MTEIQIQDRFTDVLRSCYTEHQYEACAQWIQTWYERRGLQIPPGIKLEMLSAYRRYDSFKRKHGSARRLALGDLTL